MANDSVHPAAEPVQTEAQRAQGIARLIAGFVQGAVLYGLYRAVDGNFWPANDNYSLGVLLMVFVFVPLLFAQAVGTLRLRTLVIWMAVATATLALLTIYTVWRPFEPNKFGSAGDAALTAALVVFSAAGLFIAQALVTAGDIQRRYVASYAAYFDAAWKFGVQLALSVAFVGVFWGVLWLGAVLFNLINLSFLQTLLEKSWFAIPATTLATAAAIHVTDVRSRLVAGIRTVVLTLLSWLLPLMVLIAVGFTISLPFTGLAPLWATRYAASLLLVAAATLVILINAAFQDGDPAHNRPALLRYSEFAAAIVLVPIVAIATYALWLRVVQYGWTIERIATAACILVALSYALGYAAAAINSLRGGSWMLWLETVNIATAFGVIALLLFLFTPLGDPARLSVNDQMARLKDGKVSANTFDYDYLKSEGGRYGHAALTELSTGNFGADTATVRRLAKLALAGAAAQTTPAKANLSDNVTVYPNSRALPRTFVAQDWSKTLEAPACLTSPGMKCDAFFADLDGDGAEDVILVNGNGDSYIYGTVLKEGPDKMWTIVANITGQCAGMLDALKNGHATVAAPVPVWRDWVIQGVHLHPVPTTTPMPVCRG